MPNQKLYFDYVENELVPYILVITFNSEELKWDKSIYRMKIDICHSTNDLYDIDDSIPTATIYFSDLIFNADIPDTIGINLVSLKRRISDIGVDPFVIHQFVISLPNLNELLRLIPMDRIKR